MRLSASEEATLNFYEWEYLGRGYYHFENAVDIEPPFRPFIHRQPQSAKVIDDGRVPSILQRISTYLSPHESKNDNSEEPELTPTFTTTDRKLSALSISFQQGQEINSAISVELLNMLTFSEEPISFEIIASYEYIRIQWVCGEFDLHRISSHLKAYFPNIILREVNPLDMDINLDKTVAIVDFGLSNEFMRPIAVTEHFSIDPLTSIIATMENLKQGDTVIFQTIFQGVRAPWAQNIINAVSDGKGGSFFYDSPEMRDCAISKTASPLLAVVMRVVAQGNSNEQSRYLAMELVKSISRVSESPYNHLIPLSNEGYAYEHHLMNLYKRSSNRLGMILNSGELSTFVHYPNKSVVSNKLGLREGKTKALGQPIERGIVIGTNLHNGHEQVVRLNTEHRLSHTHIIGATGVGKSTLIANMILGDINDRRGCALFDPHGDICEDVLLRIPTHRKDDVVVIDPSDTEYPIGFNLLEAHTEIEKIVLSSDLISAFKRHASVWGDNMTAVLQNAINTILESDRGGSLIDLKRLLIEEGFRNHYLFSVKDPSLHYYWKHEYPMVKKGIAPLLTRIDTFLRPKIIRYMLAQRSGIDFKTCLEENKIVLIKLSQGLIGEENSYLLGSLFLAKLNQAATARQVQDRKNRHPYFVYLDEFQHFITPSIGNILSGARKYGLGLTLAHQELSQIDDPKLLNSVLSNPYTRICFRLGDNDAKKMEAGFSYFDAQDLMGLSRGETIIRIGTTANDGNLNTFPLSTNIDLIQANEIIQSTRHQYGKPQKELEELLASMLSRPDTHKPIKEKFKEPTFPATTPIPETEPEHSKSSKIPDTLHSHLIKQETESIEIRAHTYLQSMIKKLGQDRGYIATVESPTKDGGRIDILLEANGQKIAFEISETNKPAYEVNNIKKCLKAGCIPVVVVSKNKKHLESIRLLAMNILTSNDMELVHFLQTSEIPDFLNDLGQPKVQNDEVVKGFRVVTEFEDQKGLNSKDIKSRLARLLRPKK